MTPCIMGKDPTHFTDGAGAEMLEESLAQGPACQALSCLWGWGLGIQPDSPSTSQHSFTHRVFTTARWDWSVLETAALQTLYTAVTKAPPDACSIPGLSPLHSGAWKLYIPDMLGVIVVCLSMLESRILPLKQP